VRIVWSEPAEFDLDDLFDYIARQSPTYAERFADRIIETVGRLARYPRVGRQVPEANLEHIREIVVQSQRVIDAVDDDNGVINILALVHVRQDLQSQSDKPWE